jgi:hypothetical protein
MTNNEVGTLAEILSNYIKCVRCPMRDEGFCDGVDHGIENCKNAFVVWIWDTLGEIYPNQDRSEERKSIFMNDYLKLITLQLLTMDTKQIRATAIMNPMTKASKMARQKYMSIMMSLLK